MPVQDTKASERILNDSTKVLTLHALHTNLMFVRKAYSGSGFLWSKCVNFGHGLDSDFCSAMY